MYCNKKLGSHAQFPIIDPLYVFLFFLLLLCDSPKRASVTMPLLTFSMAKCSEHFLQSNYLVSVTPQIEGLLNMLTLTVLIMTIDAQWEGMGDVGSARYEPALLPPCPTIRILSYSN